MNSPSVKWLLEVKEKSQSGKKEEKLELRLGRGEWNDYNLCFRCGVLASADPQQ